MIRLLIDYTWVYLAWSFAMIFLFSLYSEPRGWEGWVAMMVTPTIAGRFYAKRVGRKLSTGATWVFGFGSGLIGFTIFFAQVVLFLEPRPAPDGTFTHVNDFIARNMETGMMVNTFVIFACFVFWGVFMINRVIGNALSEKA